MKEAEQMILFVCSGNTCRSAMAEALARKCWRDSQGSPYVKFASAGLFAQPGDQASGHARALLAREGVDLSCHAASPVTAEQVSRATLILTMTIRHKEQLSERFPEAAGKVFQLKEYAEVTDYLTDIADPFGGTMDKYRQILEEIRVAIKKINDKINKRNL